MVRINAEWIRPVPVGVERYRKSRRHFDDLIRRCMVEEKDESEVVIKMMAT